MQGKILIVCLYVDELVYTENLMLDDSKVTMKSEFEMTYLRFMK